MNDVDGVEVGHCTSYLAEDEASFRFGDDFSSVDVV